MNCILNPDRTLKTIVSVNEVTARSPECPIDIMPDDIFIENAPDIPELFNTIQLSNDSLSWVELNQIALDDAERAKKLTAIESAIDAHILSTANLKGYNSTESCLSYVGDSNVQWNAEAVAFKTWRTQCWEYVIQEQAKIELGTRTVPTPEEAIAEIELLYPMVWP